MTTDVYDGIDLIHPPSMRPISPMTRCAWNTLVSLTKLSSSNRRNCMLAHSLCALALRRYGILSGFGAFFAMMRLCIRSRIECSIFSPIEYRHCFCRCVTISAVCL